MTECPQQVGVPCPAGLSAQRPARALPRPMPRSMPTAVALATLATAAFAFWRDGLGHLVGVWISSPTYQHGFVVPVVSGFLIAAGWQAGSARRFFAPALWGVAAACAVYAVGARWEMALLQHVGIAALVIAAIVMVCGRAFAVRHRFALGFLVFLVPFGEELVPALRELTASGVMAALDVLGIRAVRIEHLIRTDAGDFSIEEACAGLRFLIASIVASALFAHLFFRSRVRQIAFVLAGIAVPILANTVRAALTVALATHTDMQVAAGVDHLIYGWVFFAGVLGALLVIGFSAAEDGAPHRPDPPAEPMGPTPTLAVLAAVTMIAVAGSI